MNDLSASQVYPGDDIFDLLQHQILNTTQEREREREREREMF
jgi:hypothetical protein